MGITNDTSDQVRNLGGKRNIPPVLYQKLEKSALILGKIALIMAIYGLDL